MSVDPRIRRFPAVAGLQTEEQASLDALLDDELVELSALRAEVATYLWVIRQSVDASSRALPEGIAKGLTILLDGVDSKDHGPRRWIQTAVRYFVLEDEGGGGDDFADAEGFVDDARVFNAVALAMARPDLVLDLP